MEEVKTEQVQDNGSRQELTEEQWAKKLYEQADVLRRATDIDVMEVIERDAGLRERVRSGEWDFADLARTLFAAAEGAPRVVRSPGGARTGSGVGDIRGMSAAEFERLNEQLDRGYTFAG